MVSSNILLGKVHATTSREMVSVKKIFSWGAGVAHGGAQWGQKTPRISILRCEFARLQIEF